MTALAAANGCTFGMLTVAASFMGLDAFIVVGAIGLIVNAAVFFFAYE